MLGADIPARPVSVLCQLEGAFPGETLLENTATAYPVKTVAGSVEHITAKTKPCRVAMHTLWGTVVITMPFAIMPGDDDTVIIGAPTLAMLGIDVCKDLGKVAQDQHEMRIRGVETPD